MLCYRERDSRVRLRSGRGIAHGWGLLIVLALLCVSCGGPKYAYSGTLQPESAQVGSTIGGRVVAVNVTDGERVKRDQIIIALDGSDQRAQLAAAVSQEAQAAAALADLEAGARPEELTRAFAAEAQAESLYDKALTARPQLLRVAREGVHQAQATLAQAQATFTQATTSYSRAQRLYSEGAISAQARDDARAAYASAQAGVAAGHARLGSAQAQLNETQGATLPSETTVAQRAYESAVANRRLVQAGTRPQQITQARAALDAAKANVAAAESRLREMTVRAPADGIIDSLDLHPGDLVGPRVQVAAVREFHDPYVRIYIAQRDLGRAKVGDQVHVRSDALPGAVFDGTIEQIDQDAQFTPRDVQTAEDRANLSYGAKVRVHDPDGKLHGGTTVEIALE
jgi:HlyD family secretion protein